MPTILQLIDLDSIQPNPRAGMNISHRVAGRPSQPITVVVRKILGGWEREAFYEQGSMRVQVEYEKRTEPFGEAERPESWRSHTYVQQPVQELFELGRGVEPQWLYSYVDTQFACAGCWDLIRVSDLQTDSMDTEDGPDSLITHTKCPQCSCWDACDGVQQETIEAALRRRSEAQVAANEAAAFEIERVRSVRAAGPRLSGLADARFIDELLNQHTNNNEGAVFLREALERATQPRTAQRGDVMVVNESNGPNGQVEVGDMMYYDGEQWQTIDPALSHQPGQRVQDAARRWAEQQTAAAERIPTVNPTSEQVQAQGSLTWGDRYQFGSLAPHPQIGEPDERAIPLLPQDRPGAERPTEGRS